jgi:hypothetical protein
MPLIANPPPTPTHYPSSPAPKPISIIPSANGAFHTQPGVKTPGTRKTNGPALKARLMLTNRHLPPDHKSSTTKRQGMINYREPR